MTKPSPTMDTLILQSTNSTVSICRIDDSRYEQMLSFFTSPIISRRSGKYCWLAIKTAGREARGGRMHLKFPFSPTEGRLIKFTVDQSTCHSSRNVKSHERRQKLRGARDTSVLGPLACLSFTAAKERERKRKKRPSYLAITRINLVPLASSRISTRSVGSRTVRSRRGAWK